MNSFKINVGSKIPDFCAIDQKGHEISPDVLSSAPFILYFYPKDDTPGCTTQACGFRDALEEFSNLGVRIIGVSADRIESHQAFAEKYKINFSLLADENQEMIHAFGVAKGIFGPERTTFLIDSSGIVRWIERPARVQGHVERALEAIREHIHITQGEST